jgi:hypothetical protein
MQTFPCPCGKGLCSYKAAARSSAVIVVDGRPSVVESSIVVGLLEDAPPADDDNRRWSLPKGMTYDDLIRVVESGAASPSDSGPGGPYATQDIASLMPKNDGIIVECSCGDLYTVAAELHREEEW